MSNLQAALAKFRSRAAVTSNVLDQGRKEREEKLKRKAAEESKQPAAKRQAKPKAAAGRASGAASAASDGGASAASGPAQRDWKSLPPPRQLDPLPWRQMMVIEHLRKADRPLSVNEILQQTGRDLNAESDLRSSLESHPRVELLDDGLYAYQAAVQVKDRGALLDYLRKCPDPVALGEISDAYAAAAQDIEALKKEGQIMGLFSYDLQQEVLYAVDHRLAALVPLEGELRAVWDEHCGGLPDNDDDLAEEVQKIGLKPAPRKAPRKRSAAEKKKKARKAQRIRNVTNAHLLDLGIFEGDAPTQID